jgi:hypothetical protein
MRTDSTIIYTQCLKDKGIDESNISRELLDKLRTYSYILIKNNDTANFEELRESCGDILTLLLDHPDANLPIDKLFIH